MKPSIDDDLLRAFERALARDQLHMAYQPTIALADGSLSRVEALVRWDDPALGKVEPSKFVALAEENGWIDELTIWGLGTILEQWRLWRESGIDTHIAFNISAISLQRLDFPDLVERMCRSLNVPTDRIMLELTEGATQPLIKLMDTLTRFRIKGIGLAIDDFGTGYSSLLQLRRLPFTEVKIDRAFVGDVEKSKDSALIVKTIIELAQGLGLSATAEGVEKASQLSAVRAMGCDLAQGYLIAAPLAPDQLAGWIEEFNQRWPALATGKPSVAAEIEANALSQG